LIRRSTATRTVDEFKVDAVSSCSASDRNSGTSGLVSAKGAADVGDNHTVKVGVSCRKSNFNTTNSCDEVFADDTDADDTDGLGVVQVSGNSSRSWNKHLFVKVETFADENAR
jgi:hypothetical protein